METSSVSQGRVVVKQELQELQDQVVKLQLLQKARVEEEQAARGVVRTKLELPVEEKRMQGRWGEASRATGID